MLTKEAKMKTGKQQQSPCGICKNMVFLKNKGTGVPMGKDTF